MKLRGDNLLQWRVDQKRKKGVPAQAPHLAFVSRYVCKGCEKVFYYRHGDPETPQYKSRPGRVNSKGKPDKKGIYGRADPYCHRCWHKFGFSSPLYRSGCWLCDIKQATRERANGHIRDTESLQKTTPLVGNQTVAPERPPKKRKRSGVSRRAVLSGRR